MSTLDKFFLLSLIIVGCLAASCSNPPTPSDYSVEKYEGKWYEVAKYQTAGGAYF
jgi:lipocalin